MQFRNGQKVGDGTSHRHILYAGVSTAAAHLLWQIHTANLNDLENLAYRFRSNNVVGWIMFGSCVAGNVMAVV